MYIYIYVKSKKQTTTIKCETCNPLPQIGNKKSPSKAQYLSP